MRHRTPLYIKSFQPAMKTKSPYSLQLSSKLIRRVGAIAPPHVLRASSPLHRSLHILNLLERSSHFDDAAAQHSWINGDGLTHEILRFWRAIESHDEMVPAVLQHLRPHFRFGEEEGAPVGDTADYTARGQDKHTSLLSHPGKREGDFRATVDGKRGRAQLLFDFGQTSWADLDQI